jgi:hypothetical protein
MGADGMFKIKSGELTRPDAEEWRPELAPAAAKPEDFRHPELGEPSRIWAYCDREGLLEGYTCRFETVRPDGTPGKEFRPRRWGALLKNGRTRTGWHWKGWGEGRPLYGLPELLSRPDASVLIVEGERKADAARWLCPEYAAVAPMNGARSPHKTDWTSLAGRHVVIWPDNDQPGSEFARACARLAADAGATSVAIVEIPEQWPAGWDLADDPPPGVDIQTVAAMLASAVPWSAAPDPRDLPYIAQTFPLPQRISLRLKYEHYRGAVWVHTFARLEQRKDKDGNPVTDAEGNPIKDEIWTPVCTPFSLLAWLRLLDADTTYGLRLLVADRRGVPQPVDFERAELARQRAAEVKARLFAAGMRFAPGQENLIVDVLKEANPDTCLDTVAVIGWHGERFITPGADADLAGGLELAAEVRLPPEVVRKGTFAGWQNSIAAAAAAPNCPHWAFGAASGFVAPILQLCRFDTSGANLSGPTSLGKTIAQALMASSWTSPSLTSGGALKPAGVTANSIELVAQGSCGTGLGSTSWR